MSEKPRDLHAPEWIDVRRISQYEYELVARIPDGEISMHTEDDGTTVVNIGDFTSEELYGLGIQCQINGGYRNSEYEDVSRNID